MKYEQQYQLNLKRWLMDYNKDHHLYKKLQQLLLYYYELQMLDNG
jgi:hypothetical protein